VSLGLWPLFLSGYIHDHTLLLNSIFCIFGLGEWILIPAILRLVFLDSVFTTMAYNAPPPPEIIFSIANYKVQVSNGQYEGITNHLAFGHAVLFSTIKIVPAGFHSFNPRNLANNMILDVKDTSCLSCIGCR